jgi:amylosucrase
VLQTATAAVADEPEHDRLLLLARLRRHWPDLLAGLTARTATTQPRRPRAPPPWPSAGSSAPADLRLLDLQRLVDPDWFQAPGMLGYAAYADRFAGTLEGVAQRVPYLAELGVTYLHLLPLLRARPKPNDGGYAVMDYRQVRPDLGTVDDLRALSATLRAHGISLTSTSSQPRRR